MTQHIPSPRGGANDDIPEATPTLSIRETNTGLALAVDRLSESIRQIQAQLEDHRRLLEQTTLTMRGLNDPRAMPDDSQHRALVRENNMRYLSDEPAWLSGMKNTVHGNPNDYEPAPAAPTLELP